MKEARNSACHTHDSWHCQIYICIIIQNQGNIDYFENKTV